MEQKIETELDTGLWCIGIIGFQQIGVSLPSCGGLGRVSGPLVSSCLPTFGLTICDLCCCAIAAAAAVARDPHGCRVPSYVLQWYFAVMRLRAPSTPSLMLLARSVSSCSVSCRALMRCCISEWVTSCFHRVMRKECASSCIRDLKQRAPLSCSNSLKSQLKKECHGFSHMQIICLSQVSVRR